MYREFLDKNFPYLTIIPHTNIADIDSSEENNKKLLQDEEKVIIDRNYALRSLLYFEGAYEVIKKLIQEQLTKIASAPKELDKEEISKYKIKRKSFKRQNYTPNHSSSHLPESHRNNSTADKKLIGNKSEDIVYKKLVEAYTAEFVTHKSKEDEWAHYDIRYSKDKGHNWIYIEVKTFSKGHFILSKEEKNFGENNKNNYEIWLVKGYEIFCIPDLFLDDSGKYELTANEYIIFLEELES